MPNKYYTRQQLVRTAQTHQMMLNYTTDDDGVHLFCACGHDEVLGFTPSPGTAVRAEERHLVEEAIKLAEEQREKKGTS